MKKIYFVPKLEPIILNSATALLTLSEGAKEDDGVAESKRFCETSIFDDEEETENE